MDEKEALQAAIKAATQSPCCKSKRGVALWHPDADEPEVVGFNHPPKGFMCDGSKACRAHCNKLCIHAEEDVLLKIQAKDLSEYELVHVEVVDGEAVASGEPSCWQCSRKILDLRVKRVWLLHENGLQPYTARVFHRMTLENCGLPAVTR